MKKIIVAAAMIGTLLTTTTAHAQKAIKDKKLSTTEMQTSRNAIVAQKPTKLEHDAKKIEIKTTEKGTKTRTTHKSKIVKSTIDTKAAMKKQ